jgi:hypothetical protein
MGVDYTKETDARILIDDLLRQAGWDPSRKVEVLTEVTIRDIAREPHSAYVAGESTSSTGRAVHSFFSQSWWGTNDVLEAEQYNLSASRYKPQISEKPPEDEPEELIESTLKLEREIVKGLEALLKDIRSAG